MKDYADLVALSCCLYRLRRLVATKNLGLTLARASVCEGIPQARKRDPEETARDLLERETLVGRGWSFPPRTRRLFILGELLESCETGHGASFSQLIQLRINAINKNTVAEFFRSCIGL